MAWEVDFLRQMEGTSDMTLNTFYELYKRDIAKKVRHHPVRQTAAHRSQNPPLPGREEVHRHHAVGHTRLADAIQSEITSNSLAYKESYLRTIDNQLSAMLNHVVRYYNLPSYPMSGTVKDLSQICRCLGGAIGVIGLHPALLLFEQRYD